MPVIDQYKARAAAILIQSCYELTSGAAAGDAENPEVGNGGVELTAFYDGYGRGEIMCWELAR